MITKINKRFSFQINIIYAIARYRRQVCPNEIIDGLFKYIKIIKIISSGNWQKIKFAKNKIFFSFK
jgi:hypothetical protein